MRVIKLVLDLLIWGKVPELTESNGQAFGKYLSFSCTCLRSDTALVEIKLRLFIGFSMSADREYSYAES